MLIKVILGIQAVAIFFLYLYPLVFNKLLSQEGQFEPLFMFVLIACSVVGSSKYSRGNPILKLLIVVITISSVIGYHYFSTGILEKLTHI